MDPRVDSTPHGGPKPTDPPQTIPELSSPPQAGSSPRSSSRSDLVSNKIFQSQGGTLNPDISSPGAPQDLSGISRPSHCQSGASAPHSIRSPPRDSSPGRSRPQIAVANEGASKPDLVLQPLPSPLPKPNPNAVPRALEPDPSSTESGESLGPLSSPAQRAFLQKFQTALLPDPAPPSQQDASTNLLHSHSDRSEDLPVTEGIPKPPSRLGTVPTAQIHTTAPTSRGNRRGVQPADYMSKQPPGLGRASPSQIGLSITRPPTSRANRAGLPGAEYGPGPPHRLSSTGQPEIHPDKSSSPARQRTSSDHPDARYIEDPAPGNPGRLTVSRNLDEVLITGLEEDELPEEQKLQQEQRLQKLQQEHKLQQEQKLQQQQKLQQEQEQREKRHMWWEPPPKPDQEPPQWPFPEHPVTREFQLNKFVHNHRRPSSSRPPDQSGQQADYWKASYVHLTRPSGGGQLWESSQAKEACKQLNDGDQETVVQSLKRLNAIHQQESIEAAERKADVRGSMLADIPLIGRGQGEGATLIPNCTKTEENLARKGQPTANPRSGQPQTDAPMSNQPQGIDPQSDQLKEVSPQDHQLQEIDPQIHQLKEVSPQDHQLQRHNSPAGPMQIDNSLSNQLQGVDPDGDQPKRGNPQDHHLHGGTPPDYQAPEGSSRSNQPERLSLQGDQSTVGNPQDDHPQGDNLRSDQSHRSSFRTASPKDTEHSPPLPSANLTQASPLPANKKFKRNPYAFSSCSWPCRICVSAVNYLCACCDLELRPRRRGIRVDDDGKLPFVFQNFVAYKLYQSAKKNIVAKH